MSQMTKEINAITGTIIGVSGKLIVYALVILLLVEGMTRGYAFGHEVFYATAIDPEPGITYSLTIPEGQDAATVPYTAQLSCGTLGNFFIMYPTVGTNKDSLEWELEQNRTAETSPAMGFTFDASA